MVDSAAATVAKRRSGGYDNGAVSDFQRMIGPTRFGLFDLKGTRP
jgi:hypothetical protein